MKITNLFRMSSDKGRTCAFTGHRPQNLPFRFNENDDRCIALSFSISFTAFCVSSF